MAVHSSLVRRHAAKIVVLVVLAALYGFARQPTLSRDESAQLASRFSFSRFELAAPAGARKTVRTVHPKMNRISGWISSVGASVAATDLDGDGLYNDLCYVDTGTDSIVLLPAPSTGERFEVFTLDPAPLPFDAATMAPMGCLPGDLNEDGWTDVLAYYWGRPPIAFLRRTPEAAGVAPSRAAFRPVEISTPAERWYTNAATRADFDGDGHVDLLFGNYFPESSRLLDARADSYEEMQSSMSRADNGGRNRLLLWTGGSASSEPTVSFRPTEGVLQERADTGWTLSIGAADLDGDLLPEIYVGNDFGPDRLLHNRTTTAGSPSFGFAFGRRRFTEPRSKVLGHDSFKGMGTDFADTNGDGLLDIYVSNIAAPYALEESHFVWTSTGHSELLKQGVAPFVDRGEQMGVSRSGWGWDCRFADFDNDGVLEAVQATGFLRGKKNRWPELHEIAMGNDNMLHRLYAWPRLQPGDDLSGNEVNPFFVRASDGRYYDLAAEVGVGQPMITRGITLADVDGDGDLDFAVGNQWETSLLYRNDAPSSGSSMVLDLRLPVAGSQRSTPAIGAHAELRLPDGRRLVGQVDGGSGHSGKRSPEIHFGLGAASTANALPVEISWRDRGGMVHRQTYTLTPGRHAIVLGERSGKEG